MRPNRLVPLLLTLVLPAFADVRPSPRVIGGDDVAVLDDAPYVAAIYVDYDDNGFSGADFTCTASLISPSWVLTAAHCLVPESGNPVTSLPAPASIRVFYNNLFRATGEANLEAVDYVVANTSYDDFPLLHNDIALLHLANPATGVDTINLTSSAITSGTAASAAGQDDELLLFGWGTTDDNGASYPSVLQQVRLDYLDGQSCRGFWGGSFSAAEMLCAWEPDPEPADTDGEDSCFGDSGGPLIAQQDGNDYVIGITSFGSSDGCGLINGEVIPGVYTNVASYTNWVETASRQSGEGALVDHQARIGSAEILMSSSGTGIMDLSLASATNAINGINLTISGSSTAFSITPADATLSCSGNGSSNLSCTYAGSLASNSTIDAPLTINWGGAAESSGSISVTIGQTEEDMRLANNSASQDIVISDSTDLVLTMPASLAGTGTLRGQITILNRSVDVAATNTVLTLSASGVNISNVLLDGAAASCTTLADTLECALGTIAGGSTAAISYSASGGGGRVSANVTTDTVETNNGNNSDSTNFDMTTLVLNARGSSGGSLPLVAGLALLLAYRAKKSASQCSR